jgi:hypothetical protein
MNRTSYMIDNIRIDGDRYEFTCIQFCFGRRPAAANDNALPARREA